MSRHVKVMSVAFKPVDADKMLDILHSSIHTGLDLVVMPETCTGNAVQGAPPYSSTIQAVQKAAMNYQTNIVLPLYISSEGVKRINTALVINREGAIVGAYRKLYPYWSEFDIDPPCAVTDGGDYTVELDFGKIGLAICFDANFPCVWQNLYDEGAELVVWSSAYSAGMQLAAYSLIHHYPILTSTQVPDAAIYDIDGREIAYMQGADQSGADGGIVEGGACIMERTIDLDRCIFHYNFNQDKAEQLIAAHGADVEIEKDYWREQWFILRSKKDGINARELASKYHMTELCKYQENSKKDIDAMRIDIRKNL